MTGAIDVKRENRAKEKWEKSEGMVQRPPFSKEERICMARYGMARLKYNASNSDGYFTDDMAMVIFIGYAIQYQTCAERTILSFSLSPS